MRRLRSILGCFLFVLIAAQLAQPADARTLVIGTISDEPVKEIRTFSPFARYLAVQLESEGINKSKVIVANSIEQMAGYLRDGKIDLYIDSPLVALAVSELSDSRLFTRRWKRGVEAYHAVIFVRKDGGIEDMADLNGRLVAFEEPFSSSGYLLPRTTLTKAGVRFMAASGRLASIPSDRVGFVFSNDDENTMEWVLRGRVAAGAMSRSGFERLARGDLDQLRVIHQTFSVPRHVVSVGPRVSDELARHVKQVLVSMDRHQDGRAALEQFERTAKFDEIPPETLSALAEAQKPVVDILRSD